MQDKFLIAGPPTMELRKPRVRPFPLLFFATLILAILMSVGCQKNEAENTSEPTDSLANFTLFEDNENCYSFLPGTYEVGSPPERFASDTIRIYVTVKKKGYWVFNPVIISGLTFAGSGYLKDTGENVIKLLVTGIPTTPGRFEFPLGSIGGVICKPIIPVYPAGTFPPPATTTYYYRAIIGGKQYIEEVKSGNGITPGSDVNGSDDVTFTASIGPDAYPYPIGETSLSITKGTMHSYYSASDLRFQAFFQPGYHPFTAGPSFSPFLDSDGLAVDWTDPQGNYWSSYNGSGIQNHNASMKIVSAVADPDPINFYLRVKIEFTCKLYKGRTGEMIELTGGEFVGLFGKF